jgi:hypothetical protein
LIIKFGKIKVVLLSKVLNFGALLVYFPLKKLRKGNGKGAVKRV